MDALDRNLSDVFAGRVVRKDLVRKVKVGANVPVFVLEYLLGKYCATDDEAAVEAGLRVVNNTLAESFVRPEESNKAQALVRERGHHVFIDKVKVRSWRRTTSTGPNVSTSVTNTFMFLRSSSVSTTGCFLEEYGLRLKSGISTMRKPRGGRAHSGSKGSRPFN